MVQLVAMGKIIRLAGPSWNQRPFYTSWVGLFSLYNFLRGLDFFCVGELRTTEDNPIYRHEFILNQLYNKFEIYDPTFLSGVPFLPYQRTGKIKSFAGPLSDHWVASQAELGKKIVSRAIELDMKPILPTFSGLVPESIISSPYQDASTIRSQPFGALRHIFKFMLRTFSNSSAILEYRFENSYQLFLLVQFIHQTRWSTVQRDVR